MYLEKARKKIISQKRTELSVCALIRKEKGGRLWVHEEFLEERRGRILHLLGGESGFLSCWGPSWKEPFSNNQKKKKSVAPSQWQREGVKDPRGEEKRKMLSSLFK